MTYSKNKAEWLISWSRKARELYGAYQCKADTELYDRLKFAIEAVICELEEISEKLESEGTFEKK